MTAPVVAFHDTFFGEWPDVAGVAAEAPVRFAFGAEAASGAEAVVFHLPTLARLPEEKPAGQLWVGWSQESRVTCPHLDDPAVRTRLDLMVTYERSSDIWAPYFGPGTVPGLLEPPPVHVATHPVVHLQSNPYDRSGRNRYAFDLMRRVKVDSFGRVLRNRPERVPPGWEARTALMRRYKFTLAFENSICPDYVSDKFFDALVAGSVPVYRGAAEVAELAPAPGCYVDAADFSGPAELGEYLQHLDRDPAAYARLHAWRREGLSSAFRRHLERLREPTLLQLARRVADVAAPSRPRPVLRPGTWDRGIWETVAREYPLPVDLGAGDTVLDAGAHTGAFLARVAAAGAGRVVGYEAARANVELARLNTAGRPAVEVRWGALWRSDRAPATLAFTPSPTTANTGGGSVLFADEAAHRRVERARPGGSFREATPRPRLFADEVPAVPFDAVLRELGRVRLLKLDVEGAELPILLTSRELGRVDEIVGECHELSAAEMEHLAPEARVGDRPYGRDLLAATLVAAGFSVAIDPAGLFRARR